MKHAAQAAPLIATLPSGAALAQASVSQCLVTSKDESDAGVPTNVNPNPTSGAGWEEGWVVRNATLTTYIRLEPQPPVRVKVYTITASDQSTTYWEYVVSGTNADDESLPATELAQAPTDPPYTLLGSEAVQVLQFYKPIGNPPTGVLNCADTGTPPTDPADRCVYPIVVREIGPGGDTALAQTCLCSVIANPNDVTCT